MGVNIQYTMDYFHHRERREYREKHKYRFQVKILCAFGYTGYAGMFYAVERYCTC
jgi:hypothetical protein